MSGSSPKAPGKGLSAQGASSKPSTPLMNREAGNAITSAVADIVNQTAAPFQKLAAPKNVFDAFAQAQAVVGAIASLANAPTEFLNNAFARATNSISQALPSLPAATMTAMTLGIPHTHTHPPAMPPPLPGIGMVLTACPTVFICGMMAARSGDYGVGPTCGAVTPIFEIFTGSSKVFIGGGRAARIGDLTRECMSAPAAGGAAGAVSKLGKAMAVAKKVVGGVAKVSAAMGVVGAGLKIVDKSLAEGAAADAAAAAAQAATDASEDAKAAADEAAAAAQAEAISAAAEAAAAGIAAAAMGANLAMDAAKAAMGKLMGKDAGGPPCIGAIVVGAATVMIGGFPMPSWSDVAKGLKKLMSMIARGVRGGAAKGRWFCSECM